MLMVLPDSFLVWLGVILLQVTMCAATFRRLQHGFSTRGFALQVTSSQGPRRPVHPTFGSRLASTLVFAFVWASLRWCVDFMFACPIVAALRVCVCPFVAAP